VPALPGWVTDMAKTIGTLGRTRPPLDLDFDYFGAKVRVHPAANDSVEIDFMEAGKHIDTSALEAVDFEHLDTLSTEEQAALLRTLGEATQAGYDVLMGTLRRLIHPDDFDLYWRLGMENGQQIRDRMADIRALTTAVVEETTDFPIGPPSDSPRGPSTTPASSGAGSRSVETVELPRGTDLERALALERGRPDIQEFYVMEAEQAKAREAETAAKDARDRRKLTEAGLSPA
jgi:hypothetical protein